MKKILFLILLLTCSFNSNAHMAHYNKFNKIEMEILRDGEVIGYNYYFFKKDSDNTTVTNQLKFTVKLFGATIFEVEGYGEEKYIKDRLVSFNSKTLHGDAPVKETINNPSPKPNNANPKHKKKNVENLGLKLSGFSELQ